MEVNYRVIKETEHTPANVNNHSKVLELLHPGRPDAEASTTARRSGLGGSELREDLLGT